MPKNVSITLDGQTKTISGATKIQTCLEDGGNCLWIPKDDVPLTTLTVTEDGTYYPPENYYGFSKVIADGIGTTQMGELIEKTVDKNGTYNIGDESGSPYGYSKFTVNVDLSEDSGGGGDDPKQPVVGKDEDGNDEMVDTDDDGNIVMTALPTDIKVIIPPTKLEYNRYETIDYSGISVYAYISKMVHWLGTTTVQLEEGSTLNPISIAGETVTASVGDGVLYAPDRTGQNDIQLVWDGIKWIKPENYSAEKAIWKSEDYPTGKIPFEELIFPMKQANEVDPETKTVVMSSDLLRRNIIGVDSIQCADGSLRIGPYNFELAPPAYVRIYMKLSDGSYINTGRDYYTPEPLASKVFFLNVYKLYFAEKIAFITFSEPTCFVISAKKIGSSVTIYEKELYLSQGGDYYKHGGMVLFPGSNDEYYFDCIDGDVRERVDYHYAPYTFTHDGKTVEYFVDRRYSKYHDNMPLPGQSGYYTMQRMYNDYIDSHLHYDPNIVTNLDMKYDSMSLYPANIIAWTMIYGEEEANDIIPITIPVQWKRPGDGKILETTFTAWMKDEESNDGGQQPQPAPTPAPG